jgi:hypothetical protein
MTAQASDILYFDGSEYILYSEPLEFYFEQHPPRPDIEATCSACWRGYIATWRIKRDKLYMVSLQSFDGDDLALKQKLFPGDDMIFASWFTGPLVCPYGEEVEYVHMGYGTTYENYLILEVEHGIVTASNDISLDQYREWCRARYSSTQNA